MRSRQARCRTPQCPESAVRAPVPPLICRVRLARASRDPSTSVPLLGLELVRSRVLRVCELPNSPKPFDSGCFATVNGPFADSVIPQQLLSPNPNARPGRNSLPKALAHKKTSREKSFAMSKLHLLVPCSIAMRLLHMPPPVWHSGIV